MSTALVILADGFEEIEALSVVDVLRRGGVKCIMAAIGEQRSVLGAHAIRVEADCLLSDVEDEEFEALILPGGGEGTRRLGESEAVHERLRRQKDSSRLICAICAAPTILCHAGVLDPDDHITCYPTCVMELDRTCANVPVVADGNVITGQAPGSAMLFGLVILQKLLGEPISHKIARELVTDVLG